MEEGMRYATPHVGKFTDKAEALWLELRDQVVALAAKHGVDAVNTEDVNGMMQIRVDFQGTLDDIADAVDRLTAKLEGKA